MIERVPPHSVEAEQAVLAAMMVDKRACESLADYLTPRSFYRGTHGVIFAAIKRLFDKGSPADLIALTGQLREESRLEDAGGYSYLVDLASSIPTTAHADYYARMVAGAESLREAIRVFADLTAKAFDTPLDEAESFASEAAATVSTIQTKGTDGIFDARDFTAALFQEIEEAQESDGIVRGLFDTPWHDVNYLLTGFRPQGLSILAARPAMGKTSWAVNQAWHVAELLPKDDRAVVVSLEMSKEELEKRLIADLANVDSRKLGGREKLNAAEWERVTAAIRRIEESRLTIIEAPGRFTCGDLSRALNRMQSQGRRPAFVMVDYLQLMSGGSAKKGSENRTQEVSEISRGLKAIARERKIPVLALSQLSRALEGRTNKRPMLSDLRESGAIEQDADVVIFIYRDDYYNPKSKAQGLAELIIAKHRNGPIGRAVLEFQKERTRFLDYHGHYDADEEVPI